MSQSSKHSTDKTDIRSASNQNPGTANPDKSRGQDTPDHREHLEPESRDEEE